MGNGVKGPDQLSAEHIVGANVAGAGIIFFIRGGTEDDQVSVDPSRCSGLNQREVLRVAPQPIAEIDHAVFAKLRDRLTGTSINLLQEIVEGEQQPAIGSVCTLPVVDSAKWEECTFHVGGVHPQLFTRCGVKRDDGVIFGQNIHHVVDDNRIE